MSQFSTRNRAMPLRQRATQLAQRGVVPVKGSGPSTGANHSPHGSGGGTTHGDDGYSIWPAIYDVDSYDDERAVYLEAP